MDSRTYVCKACRKSYRRVRINNTPICSTCHNSTVQAYGNIPKKNDIKGWEALETFGITNHQRFKRWVNRRNPYRHNRYDEAVKLGASK